MPGPDPKEYTLDDVIRGPVDPLIAGNQTLPMSLPDMSILPPEESDDRIMISVRDDELPDNVLKAIVYGFAEEQASLKTLRQTKSKEGKDTTTISLKRGMLLKYMSETLIQKQALMGITGDLDLRGPKFREVFKMFLEIISQTFDDVKIPTEYKEMFFHQLSQNLDGWEDRAEKAVKSMMRMDG